jgi:hypothetical protein
LLRFLAAWRALTRALLSLCGGEARSDSDRPEDDRKSLYEGGRGVKALVGDARGL